MARKGRVQTVIQRIMSVKWILKRKKETEKCNVVIFEYFGTFLNMISVTLIVVPVSELSKRKVTQGFVLLGGKQF